MSILSSQSGCAARIWIVRDVDVLVVAGIQALDFTGVIRWFDHRSDRHRATWISILSVPGLQSNSTQTNNPDDDEQIICFVCDDCEVEWDTGLRIPD